VLKEIEERSFKDFKILEVGCGAGKILQEIVSELKPRVTVGLDISRAMARITRKNMLKSSKYSSVYLIVADAHKMPIREGCFDLLVSTGTLHHIKRPDELFKECSRVLKKNGEAWIYEFSYDADCKGFSKRLQRPCFLLKVLAALHGLPRNTFEKGYIKEALEKSHCKNSITMKKL